MSENTWFYTSIAYVGDKMYIKGYKQDGTPVLGSLNYKPSVFIKGTSPDGFKSFNGVHNLKRVMFQEFEELEIFLSTGVTCYGFGASSDERFKKKELIYTFLADSFPQEEIVYDINHIGVLDYDIETTSFEGFPSYLNPVEEILSIATSVLRNGKRTYKTFGTKFCGKHIKNYERCDDEAEMLKKFCKYVRASNVDIITGWNCLDINSSIWGSNKISYLKDASVGDVLLNSKINAISPISKKKCYKITLSNGSDINCSKDHIFPIFIKERDKYSNFNITNHKNSITTKELSVEHIKQELSKGDVYLSLKFDCNKNNDVDISDEELYTLGVIYTDGTISGKTVKVYNNNKEVINKVKVFFDSQKRLVRSGKVGVGVDNRSANNTYNVKCWLSSYNSLTSTINYIYLDGEKCLNVEMLSLLSKRQFCMFISGCIDGDGSISNNSISIARKSYVERKKYYELLMWNGINSTIRHNGVGISYSQKDSQFKDDIKLIINYKRDKFNSIDFTSNQTSSNKVKFRFNENELYVRVEKIEECDEDVLMLDIETDTHYYVSGGILTHNCSRFDTPYLCARVEEYYKKEWLKLLSPFDLMPKRVHKKTLNRKTGQDEEYDVYAIAGLNDLDMMRLFAKFDTYNGSIALNNIADRVLGEKKLDYSEHGSLQNLWQNDWDTFIEYNQKDVDLVDRLMDKLQFVWLAVTIAYLAKEQFEDAFSPIKTWDNYIYNYLLSKKVIIPLMKSNIKTKQNRGGRVKEAREGMSKYVVTTDAESLYPSIMISLNISPETLIRKVNIDEDSILNMSVNTDWLKSENAGMASNGCLFDNSKQGVLSYLVSSVFEKRKRFKNLMKEEKNKEDGSADLIKKYDVFQYSFKILINSAYGVFSSPRFRYYDLDIAEAITVTGQTIIRLSDNTINLFLNRYLNTEDKDFVIFSDTDSCAIVLSDVVEQDTFEGDVIDYLDVFYRDKIDPNIKEAFKKFALFNNFHQNSINFKREKIIEKLVITGKKRYFGIVNDVEGYRYKVPEMFAVGADIVRSTTPEVVKGPLTECMKIILNGTEEELQAYVKAYRKRYYEFPIEKIAIPKGVNALNKFSIRAGWNNGTPMQVRASILYNQLLEKHSLQNSYETIKNSDKIKYTYLKLPNPLFENVIGFKTSFPKEFELDEYVDYKTMYEKSFLVPLVTILDAVSWSVEKKYMLDI